MQNMLLLLGSCFGKTTPRWQPVFHSSYVPGTTQRQGNRPL